MDNIYNINNNPNSQSKHVQKKLCHSNMLTNGYFKLIKHQKF